MSFPFRASSTRISTATNGFLLTWFAPTDDLFQVQWTPAFADQLGHVHQYYLFQSTFSSSPTNTQFNFFDDGSQTGGFGPMRFYRLILLATSTGSTLPSQTNYIATVSVPFTVTNTATDSNTNTILLTL